LVDVQLEQVYEETCPDVRLPVQKMVVGDGVGITPAVLKEFVNTLLLVGVEEMMVDQVPIGVPVGPVTGLEEGKLYWLGKLAT
jgi:hypothetical protein